jgi:multidrug resistance efflux pump
MPLPFVRTFRALEIDGGAGRGLLPVAAGVVIAAWLAWFFLGRVGVHEVTDSARLEVVSAVHPVAARFDGQIVRSTLAIGREVRAGEILVELDHELETLALSQGEARLDDARARLVALRAEIDHEKNAAIAHERAGQLSIEESAARIAESESRAKLASERAATTEQLVRDGTASNESLREARAEADATRAAHLALRIGSTRLAADVDAITADRRARISRLESEAVELDGAIAVELASNRRLEYEIELRSIRAPIDGRIGEASELHPGSVVETGQRLGAIVPMGVPRVVGHFPLTGVGRIRPGQTARLRVHGFPWTEFGTLAALVTNVASEPTDGRIRVELVLGENSASAIPIEHGVTADAEIEVERISPARLILRTAGELLATRAPLVTDDGEAPSANPAESAR